MAGLKDLFMDFMPNVPGMPPAHARRFLSIAADDFLTRSELWREPWEIVESEGEDWTDDGAGVIFTTFGDKGTNSTRNPSGDEDSWMRVVRVTELFYKLDDALAVQVPFMTREKLARCDADYRSTLGATPQCWYDLSVDGAAPRIGIYPTPETTQVGVFFPTLIHSVKRMDTQETAALDYAAVGTETQFRIPEFIYLQFGQAIVSGALSRAMLVPGKDWTNPQLAGVHAGIFEDGIVKAKSQSQAGHTNHTQREMMYGGY